MNDSSENFQLDEHLARLLAAYDPGMDGSDPRAPTIQMPRLPPLPGERAVKPLSVANEGSAGELLPDSLGNGGHRPSEQRTPVPTPPPPAPAPHGHRIGRFELRRQLGKGGCGIVFLAFDPKLEREVALKIPRPEMLLSEDARRRLVREALAAAEFDHPNLVPVYETGEIGPVCFIATAFCPGQTLGEWLDRQAFPVPVRQSARLVATVAEAVQHAHDRGVLHRDLKPNNIILQATKEDPIEQEPPLGSVQMRGEHYTPRVVDFGLAKLLERGGPSETNTRQILGTPKYMAPEQAQARHDDVGPPADVYALGVILYEMLTGRAPFEGATDVEVLRQAIDGNLIQPRHIRADIPRDLEAICLKAMDRVPGKRYRTAIDLSDDLRRFLDDKPTLARPLKWAGRAARWLRRNDQVVALAVVTTIAAVLLAVGWWSLAQTRQLKNDRDTALRDQADRTRADQQREYAKHVRAAFLAWRTGDRKAATEYLDSASRVAGVLSEMPDFAHAYLSRLVSVDRLTIVCPAGAVTALAVTADGKRLASGHADGTITVWDAKTGELLGAAPSETGRGVRQLVFALGGARLLAADGRALACWAVGRTGELQPIRGTLDHAPGIDCLAATADGRAVYGGTSRGEVVRIDPRDPLSVRAVSLVPDDPVRAVSVSRNGKHVVLGTAGGRVIWCDDRLDRSGAATSRFDHPVSALTPPGDEGDWPTVGFATGEVLTSVGVEAGSGLRAGPESGVHWLAATVCGDASNWATGYVRFAAAGEVLLGSGAEGVVRAGAATADGQILFTAGDDGVVRSWSLPADARTSGVRSIHRATAVGVHPEGGRFAVCDKQGLSEYPEGRGQTTNPGWGRETASVRFPRSGAGVVAHADGRSILVRSVQPGAEAVRHTLPDGATAAAVDLSTDATTLAAGDDRGRVHLWSVGERKLLGTADGGTGKPVRRVALSADGRVVAAPAAEGVALWLVGEPRPVMVVAADDRAVFAVSAAGDRLATAGRSGVVRVWSAFGGREEATFHGHVGRVTGLALSPDGRTLVSGGVTGEVFFWDLRTGQELMSFRRHTGPVSVVEFAANGKLLVTAGTQLAVWEAARE